MKVDWGRLKAVVFESDDWGLCAWVPDDQAYRAMADTPAWRSTAGRHYGRSTLESAADVARLAQTLLEFRGGDGFPPVWQANTIMGAPDYARLAPPRFEVDELPMVMLPEFPPRWRRPGLWQEVQKAQEAGVWWGELHGLHHLPVTAWLQALRHGSADARRAHQNEVLVCQAVETSGEYDPSEPKDVRVRNLVRAVEHFRVLFKRDPASICPPDYRWDESLEADAERLGIRIVQGLGEQAGSFARARRWFHQTRWPDPSGTRFYMPARIAFEPRGGTDVRSPVGAVRAHAGARAAWSRGQPAVISTHRVNYAHLDAAWSEAGRGALRDLLSRLMADGATFLTDAEVRALSERGWSSRPIGSRGALVRSYGPGRSSVRVPMPAAARRAVVREGSTSGVDLRLEEGHAVAALDPGEYLLEWQH
ncbi:MAG TPA: hypothetical protein VFQ05_02225 [Candidatus Eisenbacteria bacterium]|nr:hypothetical protein [Candidatus Eisenbacteria bacterium]